MKAMKMLLGAFVALMVLGGMAAASTTQVKADLGNYLVINSFPTTLDFGHLTPGVAALIPSSLSIAANTNWQVQAFTPTDLDNPWYAGHLGDWYGKLWSPTLVPDGFGISNPMTIDGNSLSDTPTAISNGNPTSAQTISFNLGQEVGFTDKPASDYDSIIEFDIVAI